MDVAPGLLPLLRGPRLMPIYALASFAMIGVVGGWVGGMLLKSRGLGLAGNIAVGVIGALIGGVLVSAVGLAALGERGALYAAAIGAAVALSALGLARKSWTVRRQGEVITEGLWNAPSVRGGIRPNSPRRRSAC